MAENRFFTARVRNPLYTKEEIAQGNIPENKEWISVYRVNGDVSERKATSLQLLDNEGEPLEVGSASIPVYLNDGIFSEIETLEIEKETITQGLEYETEFDAIQSIEFDSLGRVTKVNIKRFKLPGPSAKVSETEPSSNDTILWIKA